MKAKFEVTITGKWLENSTPATAAMAERRLRRAAKDGFDFLATVTVAKSRVDQVQEELDEWRFTNRIDEQERELGRRSARIAELEKQHATVLVEYHADRGRIAELEAAIDKLAAGKGRYHTEANYLALVEVRNKSLHK